MNNYIFNSIGNLDDDVMKNIINSYNQTYKLNINFVISDLRQNKLIPNNLTYGLSSHIISYDSNSFNGLSKFTTILVSKGDIGLQCVKGKKGDQNILMIL